MLSAASLVGVSDTVTMCLSGASINLAPSEKVRGAQVNALES